jgi:hypothetical protein
VEIAVDVCRAHTIPKSAQRQASLRLLFRYSTLGNSQRI